MTSVQDGCAVRNPFRTGMPRTVVRRSLSALVLAAAALLPVACSPPTVPDVTYFRLPPSSALPHADKALSLLPIEVSAFTGEGIYAEQALIYALGSDASALRTYHYQLWSEPPSRGLQDRLIEMLRESGVSPLVTDRLPASTQALRVHGSILRYERVKQDAGTYRVVVALQIRVEQDDGEPLLEQTYRAEQPAAGDAIDASVKAFGAAVDHAFADFYRDLIGLKGAHAG